MVQPSSTQQSGGKAAYRAGYDDGDVVLVRAPHPLTCVPSHLRCSCPCVTDGGYCGGGPATCSTTRGSVALWSASAPSARRTTSACSGKDTAPPAPTWRTPVPPSRPPLLPPTLRPPHPPPTRTSRAARSCGKTRCSAVSKRRNPRWRRACAGSAAPASRRLQAVTKDVRGRTRIATNRFWCCSNARPSQTGFVCNEYRIVQPMSLSARVERSRAVSAGSCGVCNSEQLLPMLTYKWGCARHCSSDGQPTVNTHN